MRRTALILSSFVALCASAHAGDQIELSASLRGTAKVKRRLDLLAADPSLAEQHLGKGVRIVALGTTSMPKQKWFDIGDGDRIHVRANPANEPALTLSFKPKAGLNLSPFTSGSRSASPLRTRCASGTCSARGTSTAARG